MRLPGPDRTGVSRLSVGLPAGVCRRRPGTHGRDAPGAAAAVLERMFPERLRSQPIRRLVRRVSRRRLTRTGELPGGLPDDPLLWHGLSSRSDTGRGCGSGNGIRVWTGVESGARLPLRSLRRCGMGLSRGAAQAEATLPAARHDGGAVSQHHGRCHAKAAGYFRPSHLSAPAIAGRALRARTGARIGLRSNLSHQRDPGELSAAGVYRAQP